MTNETVFADRVARINTAAKKGARKHRVRRERNLGSMLVTPIMMVFVMAGGMVYAWEAMDRPTDNPFAMAHILTSQVLSN
ncbi:hypothetical protein [Sulfitobacter aestuariivivens]|uniref:Uncharacterized protein n=1 Tax=Sulfitobacter aestuariivivens TaxID=2766981 RepID=A0A927D3M8_9RHOB|nr:hypothetical protein [Sulfitobacter aestuariivivens]MBD3664503.1 hypothetical protein [Sulfitobacter aestuariivivens]